MTVLIDTNVILDILLKREPFFSDSYEAVKKLAVDDSVCMVSASAATDIFYLLRRGLNSSSKAKDSMERLLQLVDFVDVLSIDIQAALADSITDFEDAVVHALAARNQADYIITRSTKDFKGSVIPVVTPKEFLAL